MNKISTITKISFITIILLTAVFVGSFVSSTVFDTNISISAIAHAFGGDGGGDGGGGGTDGGNGGGGGETGGGCCDDDDGGGDGNDEPTPPTAAPTCTLSVNPASVESGNEAFLSWISNNALSGAVDNNIGTATPVSGGSTTVTPPITTTYTGTFTPIRELFATVPESRMRG
ncbi:hypothetical protein IIB50_02315, partial [Patescibacteria group bacterium]|nr:hypothetical protein [Patescibacteria group bacterium]